MDVAKLDLLRVFEWGNRGSHQLLSLRETVEISKLAHARYTWLARRLFVYRREVSFKYAEAERMTTHAMGRETGFRTVIAAVDDMFFASKIRATAKALGMTVSFPRTLTALISLAGDELPDLFIVDLHNARLDPIELAGQLKSSENLKPVPLLGFFSHVNVDLQRQAIEAGYDEVLPRSLFARDLANILAGTSLNKEK